MKCDNCARYSLRDDCLWAPNQTETPIFFAGFDRHGIIRPWLRGLIVISWGVCTTQNSAHSYSCGRLRQDGHPSYLHPTNTITRHSVPCPALHCTVLYLRHRYVNHNGPAGRESPVSMHRRRCAINQDCFSEQRPEANRQKATCTTDRQRVTQRELPRSHATIGDGREGALFPWQSTSNCR